MPTLRTTSATLLAALCLLTVSAVPVWAQAELPTEEQEDVVLRPTDDGSDAAMPGLALPDARPARGQELAEGTFIVDAQGIVVALTTGGWAFVFDEDTEGKADPPMVLQPSMQTAAMLRLVDARDDTVTFRLAGEVQRYLGRHYLLPTRFDVISDDRAEERADAEERAEEVQAELEASGQETGDDLAARVDAAEREGVRAIPNATITGDDEEIDATRLVPEGSLVLDVAGRVYRGGSGLWVFASDNDADTRGDEELVGEVILVPSLMLEALERDIAIAGVRARLTLSGRVLVYEGRNYMLPTLYRLRRDTGGNLTTAQ